VNCDYCDDGVPVVCGECGVTVEQMMPPAHGWTGQDATYNHEARPVHRIRDPEGVEGTWLIPCARAVRVRG